MKVIILSAGQGKRLLPMTANIPKCLLKIQDLTLIEWQIRELHKCGLDRITVVTGYGADKVDALLHEKYGQLEIKTHYNPDYAKTDNLVSCWKVRDQMSEDFILLNGDTLFEAAVLKTLLASPETPVTMTINHKERYDEDDMKVSLAEENRLTRVGKDIPPNHIHGESIGMILFRGVGPKIFRKGLEKAVAETSAGHKWYLSVIDTIAKESNVKTCSIGDLLWCEVDYPEDLTNATGVVAGFPTGNDSNHCEKYSVKEIAAVQQC